MSNFKAGGPYGAHKQSVLVTGGGSPSLSHSKTHGNGTGRDTFFFRNKNVSTHQASALRHCCQAMLGCAVTPCWDAAKICFVGHCLYWLRLLTALPLSTAPAAGNRGNISLQERLTDCASTSKVGSAFQPVQRRSDYSGTVQRHTHP